MSSPLDAPDRDDMRDVVALGSAAEWHCTGILVSPSWVLTAAHCLPVKRAGFGLEARVPMEVYEVDRSERQEEDGPDVALLHLARPANAWAVSRPRYPPSGGRPSGTVRFVGFGITAAGATETYGLKRYANVPLSGWGCDGSRPSVLGCDPQNELLVEGWRGRDTCAGDSGGPLFLLRANAWVLLGITSRGMPPRPETCGHGSIDVRVDAIEPWLASHLESSPENQRSP